MTKSIVSWLYKYQLHLPMESYYKRTGYRIHTNFKFVRRIFYRKSQKCLSLHSFLINMLSTVSPFISLSLIYIFVISTYEVTPAPIDIVSDGNVTYSFIKYWDIDDSPSMPESEKTEVKNGILQEFILYENEIPCLCPKIAYPFVCDNKGYLHPSVCIFYCKKHSNTITDMKPTMIMITTPYPKAEELCHQQFGKKELSYGRRP